MKKRRRRRERRRAEDVENSIWSQSFCHGYSSKWLLNAPVFFSTS